MDTNSISDLVLKIYEEWKTKNGDIYAQTKEVDSLYTADNTTAEESNQDEQSLYTGFIIDDLSKAEWATKKIIKYQNDIQSKIEQARKMKDNYLAEVNNWLKTETEDAQRNIDSLSAMLQPFIENELAGKKKRSINLPSGRAGFKKGNTTFYYGNDKASKDNQQLLEFLVDNHYTEYVKTEIIESVDWGNFKKQLTVTDDGNVVVASTGEIIDVMTANQEPDKFYVQPLVKE